MPSRCQKCGSAFFTTLRKLFASLFTLILALVLMFIIPWTLLIISVPFGTIRYLVKIYAKFIRPDLGKMVTLVGQTLTTDRLFTNPRLTISVGVIMEGTLDIKSFKDTVTRNLLQSTFPNGELKYPEIKQYLTSWMGYYFWKDDETFDLERHIISVNKDNLSTYSDVDIQDFYRKQFDKPWTKQRPVWEINVMTNYYPDGPEKTNTVHTAVFLNFQHTLGDGYSGLNLSQEFLDVDETFAKVPVPTYPEKSILMYLVYFITLPFMIGYESAVIVVQGLFGVPFTPSQDLKQKSHTFVADKISVNQIKDIMKHFGVSFASVVNAVEAGSLRDFMIYKGYKVPDLLFEGIALPLPGHSKKLRNYSTGGNCVLPIGEPDPVKRLEFCSKDYQRLKSSVTPIITRLIFLTAGSTPTVMMRPFAHLIAPITVGVSSFPAGYEQRSFEGCKLVDVFFSGGAGPLGLVFCCLSYMDGLRITAQCKESVMTMEELTNMTKQFQKHLDILHDKIVKEV